MSLPLKDFRTGTFQPLERRCLTPSEMEGRGMSRSDRGFWITSPMAILRGDGCKTAEISTDPLPPQGVGEDAAAESRGTIR